MSHFKYSRTLLPSKSIVSRVFGEASQATCSVHVVIHQCHIWELWSEAPHSRCPSDDICQRKQSVGANQATRWSTGGPLVYFSCHLPSLKAPVRVILFVSENKDTLSHGDTHCFVTTPHGPPFISPQTLVQYPLGARHWERHRNIYLLLNFWSMTCKCLSLKTSPASLRTYPTQTTETRIAIVQTTFLTSARSPFL